MARGERCRQRPAGGTGFGEGGCRSSPANYRGEVLPAGAAQICVKGSQVAFDSATDLIGRGTTPIKRLVTWKMLTQNPKPAVSIPWAMQMKAISVEEPGRLVQSLTGAILGCGGWVLSRGANDSGTVNMLFEFERQACLDIYSVLVAAGLELSQSGHIRLTELCQCTRSRNRDCGSEIASVDIEIQTYPDERALTRPARGGI